MAFNFSVQRPYVLTALPQPLDPSTGRYHVGEVSGTSGGSKKRKRPELAVAIDGEAMNIYDVSSARLVTSYPVPPQACFTCAPCSIRRRTPESKVTTRYTYVASRDLGHKINLFKDQADASGKTTSSTQSFLSNSTQPVAFIGTRTAPRAASKGALDASHDEVLAVLEDGQIFGLDGESLQQIWKVSASILRQDVSIEPEQPLRVETCIMSTAEEVVQGIFNGKRDYLPSLPGDGNPELLLLLSSTPSGPRHLHILGPAPPSQLNSSSGPGLVQIHLISLKSNPLPKAEIRSLFRLNIRSGSLSELTNGNLIMHDLTTSIPRITQELVLQQSTSFLRLSPTSVLVSTPTCLDLYNPRYQSLQSSTPVNLEKKYDLNTNQYRHETGISLVTYFSKLELVVGLYDNSLVAFQLEAPQTRAKKRRAEGLLIDSIGRGITESKKSRSVTCTDSVVPATSVFSKPIPGFITTDYLEELASEMGKADSSLGSNQFDDFEVRLAQKLGLKAQKSQLTNGITTKENEGGGREAPKWTWPENESAYPRVDRRWIHYAISRTFQWSNAQQDDKLDPNLSYILPYTNVLNYLVTAGHLTLSNMKSALRDQTSNAKDVEKELPRRLVLCLTEIDPSLELLTNYISTTSLGPVELLLATRAIMKSLELMHDVNNPLPQLLTNGHIEGDNDIGGALGVELDELEQEIDKTESYLSGNTSVRGQGLSLALAKLGSCPPKSMVQALRSTFRPDEILSLIYMLRTELSKGGWTSRYLDEVTDLDENADADAPPDGIVKLIADLLSRCVDSIGPGGWLLNDKLFFGTFSADEAASNAAVDETSCDFIAALRLEVSAALEGIEETVRLRGLVKETLSYFDARERFERGRTKMDLAKPISIHVREIGAATLPLGLKTRRQPFEDEKVVGGGEIVTRSAREKGLLISQQIGSYSLERIVV